MKILITGASSEITRAIRERREAVFNDQVLLTTSKLPFVETPGILPFSFENPKAGEDRLNEVFKSGVDALVLNAFSRLDQLKRIHEWDDNATQTYLRTNIEGNLALIRLALPHFIARKSGRIILISSLSVETGTSLYGPYCMAKGALEALIKNISTDYASDGVLSNIIQLGIIRTERNARLWRRSKYEELLTTLIPQASAGTPAQVACALDSFLSEHSYITGSTLKVAGGFPSIQSNKLLKEWMRS